MRWIDLCLFCVIFTAVCAEPDPKKYKSDSLEKGKETSLTDDEKKFLREVEAKFGVKSDVPIENKKDETDKKNQESPATPKAPFPAVIAIEIVNDTDSKTKGKRTIDANLGYGYRTNNGYSYSYFGRPAEDKGKFMIYPYSQEDIPPAHHAEYSSGKYITNVEIQPSQAYELVSVKDEQSGYDYKKPGIEFKTPASQPISSQVSHPSTLYTTYNGQEFSGLSKEFPTVMPNYFVDPTQLLKNPQYQSVGLTQDHLRTHGPQLDQRVVPVLVLRVPSSYIKNPSAELYANLPNNYPLSQYLNNVNLQELVNQYFKSHGYSFAPQIMTYQKSPLLSSHSVNHEPQYSNPYVQPTYTQADYSGVQYSAVKPVMATYPQSGTQYKYSVPESQSLYQKPSEHQEQQYEYQYQYVPQTPGHTQTYYVQPQPQYQQAVQSAEVSQEYQSEQSVGDHQGVHETVEYRTPQYSSGQDSKVGPVLYETSQQYSQQESPQPEITHYSSASADSSAHVKDSSHSEYYSSKQAAQKPSISIYPSQLIHSEKYEEPASPSPSQEYVYSHSHSQNQEAESLPLSENYPSKDHTIATVLPYSYKSAKKPHTQTVQSVSYVTPSYTSNYQSQYRIMVPQTVFKHPNSEKVTYVNSHSVPMHYTQTHYQDSSSEEQYSGGAQYVSPLHTKFTYPRNYRSHPKRMAKPENKTMASSISSKKQNEKKKSS